MGMTIAIDKSYMNKMPKSCKECRHVGEYTSGVWSRNPHYCCELIWRLFEEDYRVNPDTVDSRCPLNDERIESYLKENNGDEI